MYWVFCLSTESVLKGTLERLGYDVLRLNQRQVIEKYISDKDGRPKMLFFAHLLVAENP